MKISALLLSIITALALVASPSVQAKPSKVTKLTFPKGSYCTSFTGETTGRTFAVQLMPNQTLSIEDIDPKDVDDIVVKNPKGRIMSLEGYGYSWKTTMKGKYTIKIISREGINWHDDIKFCAYYNKLDD